jgi:hypothetical protein
MRTWIVPPVRVCCVNCFTAVAWLLRGLLRQLLRDLPTGCQPDRFVICFADFTGICPDIYQPLRQPLHGHSSLLHETFPATARTLRGCCSDASPDTAWALRNLPTVCFVPAKWTASRFANPMLTWLLRDVLRQMPTMLLTEMLTLILLRGWCHRATCSCLDDCSIC